MVGYIFDLLSEAIFYLLRTFDLMCEAIFYLLRTFLTVAMVTKLL